jgi:hypothetical protein
VRITVRFSEQAPPDLRRDPGGARALPAGPDRALPRPGGDHCRQDLITIPPVENLPGARGPSGHFRPGSGHPRRADVELDAFTRRSAWWPSPMGRGRRVTWPASSALRAGARWWRGPTWPTARPGRADGPPAGLTPHGDGETPADVHWSSGCSASHLRARRLLRQLLGAIRRERRPTACSSAASRVAAGLASERIHRQAGAT